MREIKKIQVVLASVMVMLLFLAACSSGNNSTSPSSTPTVSPPASQNNATEAPSNQTVSKEPITIKMLWANPGVAARWNNFKDSAAQKAIRKATGITLEIVDADQEKFNVMLASGDLPDIIVANNNPINQFIEGNNIIALDDLLQSNGQDVLETIPQALAISKKYWSLGQDKTYFLPTHVGSEGRPLEDTVGPVIRWDLYKDLGHPAINNEDDLLNVIKQMVDKNPTTADGKPVYGVSAWTDSGNWNLWMAGAIYGGVPSMEIVNHSYTNVLTNAGSDLNSALWKGITFFYKANKLGILDPDALLQKNSDYATKATNGQILFGPATWSMGRFNAENANDGKGFMVLPLEWANQHSGGNSPTGWGKIAISSKSKNPERAMDLLNYLWSYDGAREIYSGGKDSEWDIVDGKPKLREETLELFKQGGTGWLESQIHSSISNNFVGINESMIHPDDGMPLDLFQTPEIFAKTLNPLHKDFSDHYKVAYPGEMMQKLLEAGKGKITNHRGINSLAENLQDPVPDDINRIVARLKDLIGVHAAKVIMSKSDAEFEKNQQEAIAAFKEAGSDKVFEWKVNAFQAAVEKAKDFQ